MCQTHITGAHSPTKGINTMRVRQSIREEYILEGGIKMRICVILHYHIIPAYSSVEGDAPPVSQVGYSDSGDASAIFIPYAATDFVSS